MTSKFWLIIVLLHYCCRFYCMIAAIFTVLSLPFLLHFLIPITLRTPSGAELRIRGIMDSLMVSTIIASTGGRRNV